MPDQDLLPPGHTLTAAPRPPAGLGEVLVRATRRRRRQQAGALATGAAACAAAFALTVASGSAVDSLGVTPAHPTDGNAPAVTAPERGGSAELASAAPSETGQGDDAMRTDAQTTGAAGEQPPAVAYGTTTSAQQTKPGTEVGPPHTMTAYDPSRGCGGWLSNAAEGWCGYYDGAISGPAGKSVELAETVCRLPNRGTATLVSDNGQQAEFTAHNKDAYTVWTWSTGHRFAKRETRIAVPAGSCVRWQVPWNLVDARGRPLPVGAYQIDPKPWMHPAASTGPASVWTDANFVTFTVTR